MLITDIKTLVNEVIDNIDHISTVENPTGSGYFNLTKTEYTDKDGEEVTLTSFFEVCKYKDDSSKRFYYGVYSGAEVDGGDNICPYEWDYTDKLSKKELKSIIENLAEKVFSDDEMIRMYNESI